LKPIRGRSPYLCQAGSGPSCLVIAPRVGLDFRRGSGSLGIGALLGYSIVEHAGKILARG